MTRKTLNAAIAAALFGSLALAGCKKKEEVTPPPAAETTPAPAPTPPPMAEQPAAISVTSVDLGTAVDATTNKVGSPAMSFAKADKTLYASVATDGGGGTLTAKWTFQDGQVVNTEDKTVPAGAQVTEFHVNKPDGWPAGKYKVEISTGGNVVQSKDFEIK